MRKKRALNETRRLTGDIPMLETSKHGNYIYNELLACQNTEYILVLR